MDPTTDPNYPHRTGVSKHKPRDSGYAGDIQTPSAVVSSGGRDPAFVPAIPGSFPEEPPVSHEIRSSHEHPKEESGLKKIINKLNPLHRSASPSPERRPVTGTAANLTSHAPVSAPTQSGTTTAMTGTRAPTTESSSHSRQPGLSAENVNYSGQDSRTVGEKLQDTLDPRRQVPDNIHRPGVGGPGLVAAGAAGVGAAGLGAQQYAQHQSQTGTAQSTTQPSTTRPDYSGQDNRSLKDKVADKIIPDRQTSETGPGYAPRMATGGAMLPPMTGREPQFSDKNVAYTGQDDRTLKEKVEDKFQSGHHTSEMGPPGYTSSAQDERSLTEKVKDKVLPDRQSSDPRHGHGAEIAGAGALGAGAVGAGAVGAGVMSQNLYQHHSSGTEGPGIVGQTPHEHHAPATTGSGIAGQLPHEQHEAGIRGPGVVGQTPHQHHHEHGVHHHQPSSYNDPIARASGQQGQMSDPIYADRHATSGAHNDRSLMEKVKDKVLPDRQSSDPRHEHGSDPRHEHGSDPKHGHAAEIAGAGALGAGAVGAGVVSQNPYQHHSPGTEGPGIVGQTPHEHHAPATTGSGIAGQLPHEQHEAGIRGPGVVGQSPHQHHHEHGVHHQQPSSYNDPQYMAKQGQVGTHTSQPTTDKSHHVGPAAAAGAGGAAVLAGGALSSHKQHSSQTGSDPREQKHADSTVPVESHDDRSTLQKVKDKLLPGHHSSPPRDHRTSGAGSTTEHPHSSQQERNVLHRETPVVAADSRQPYRAMDTASSRQTTEPGYQQHQPTSGVTGIEHSLRKTRLHNDNPQQTMDERSLPYSADSTNTLGQTHTSEVPSSRSHGLGTTGMTMGGAAVGTAAAGLAAAHHTSHTSQAQQAAEEKPSAGTRIKEAVTGVLPGNSRSDEKDDYNQSRNTQSQDTTTSAVGQGPTTGQQGHHPQYQQQTQYSAPLGQGSQYPNTVGGVASSDIGTQRPVTYVPVDMIGGKPSTHDSSRRDAGYQGTTSSGQQQHNVLYGSQAPNVESENYQPGYSIPPAQRETQRDVAADQQRYTDPSSMSTAQQSGLRQQPQAQQQQTQQSQTSTGQGDNTTASHATGFHSEGGNFDASMPNAGAEAARLANRVEQFGTSLDPSLR